MSFVEDLFNLDGKVAVVIGGGGVLAGAMAEGLAKAGAKVAIVDLSLEHAEKRAADIKNNIGVDAIAVQADASSKQALEDAKAKVVSEWGRVDILLNAPGINSATPFLEITEGEWQKIIDVNLKSIFLASQIFGQQMLDQGEGGSIINISSASSGPPLTRVFTYGVSKAALNNVTQFLAKEWAEQKIRVNAIAPGFFPAEQNRKVLTEDRIASIFKHTPMNRFGEADELIGAVVWLSSEKASSFVTGSIVRVDGGFTAMSI